MSARIRAMHRLADADTNRYRYTNQQQRKRELHVKLLLLVVLQPPIPYRPKAPHTLPISPFLLLHGALLLQRLSGRPHLTLFASINANLARERVLFLSTGCKRCGMTAFEVLLIVRLAVAVAGVDAFEGDWGVLVEG